MTLKEKLGKQLRFYTNKSNKLKSIEQYIGDMKEGQDKIYYITGESIEFVNNSVFLEGLNKKGYEVLYCRPEPEFLEQGIARRDL